MLSFNDLFRFVGDYPQIVSDKTFDDIQTEAVRNIASKSFLGAIIVPFCFLIACIVAEFYSYYPFVFILLLVPMFIGAGLRIWTIGYLKDERRQERPLYLDLFTLACCLMGLSWGGAMGFFLYAFGSTFPFYMIMVMGAGIGAGTVTNFSSWRSLTFCYLSSMNLPTILIGLAFGDPEVYAVIVAFSCFLIYMLDQAFHRNSEYWHGLIKSVLFETQAQELQIANEQLAGKMEEQEAFQQELEASRQKLRDLFDYSRDAIMIYSMDGVILELNQTMREMFLIENPESLNVSLLRQLSAPGNSFKGFRQLLLKVADGEEVDFEWHARKQLSGELFWIQVNMRKLSWRREDIFFITVRDITEQKNVEFERDRAEGSLVKSEGYIQAILENSSNPVFSKDLSGKYILVNQHFAELAGLDVHEITGKLDSDIFSEANAALLSENETRVKEQLESIENEGIFELDGNEKSLLISKFPLFDEKSELYATGGICTDITSIRKAYHELEEANRVKSKFLANMSHELRTPMHGILSFTRLTSKKLESASHDKLQAYLSMVVTNGTHLLDLLDDLLDLSKMDAGEMVYKKEVGDIADEIGAVMNEQQGTAEEKNIVIHCVDEYSQAVNEQDILEYDSNRIKQVLRNLLSNAIKFSEKDSSIEVRLEVTHIKKKKHVLIKVVDHGIGIPEDELELVFETFVQGSQAKGGVGGAGLGLAICRQVVISHGGTIWAEKGAEGGAVMCLTLPFSRQ